MFKNRFPTHIYSYTPTYSYAPYTPQKWVPALAHTVHPFDVRMYTCGFGFNMRLPNTLAFNTAAENQQLDTLSFSSHCLV